MTFLLFVLLFLFKEKTEYSLKCHICLFLFIFDILNNCLSTAVEYTCYSAFITSKWAWICPYLYVCVLTFLR